MKIHYCFVLIKANIREKVHPSSLRIQSARIQSAAIIEQKQKMIIKHQVIRDENSQPRTGQRKLFTRDHPIVFRQVWKGVR
jgi:hypothetical protein